MDSIRKLITGKNVDTAVYIALWVIVMIYIVYQAHVQRWDSVIALVVVFGFFYFSMEYFHLDLAFVLTISLLVSYIATFDVQPKGSEHFENPADEPTDANLNDNDDDDTATPTADDKKVTTTVDEKKKDDGENENFEDNVNIGKTFMEAYKSLTPDQIESMTNDTKELLATQQNLMSTIKSLAPVVMQGKEMLDNFKDYFGKDGMQGTMSSLKGTTDVLSSIAPALKQIQGATGSSLTGSKSS